MPARTGRTPRLPAPDIVRRQVVLEEHDLAPDGSFAIVSRRVVDGNGYASHLWLVPMGHRGSSRPPRPRRLTRGPGRDMRPAISPDGRRVAFTRRDKGADDASLLVLDLDGGEADRRTSGLGVGEIAWSPDGRWLAFTAEVDPQRFMVGPAPKRGEEPMARHVTRLDWRFDETGYLDRRSQLHVVPASGDGAARRLSGVASGATGIAWRPDGRAIAFVADPREDADRHPRTSIWEVAFDGRGRGAIPEPREVLSLAGPVRAPAYSPDGRWLAAIGVDAAADLDDLAPALFVGPADGAAPAVPLAPEIDRPVGSWAATDLTGWQAESRPGPAWDGADAIVALVSERGRCHPWRFGIDPATGRSTGAPVPLAGGDVMATTVALGGGLVTVTATIGARPPELALVEGGVVNQITTMVS